MKNMILVSLFTVMMASSAFAGSKYNDSLKKIDAVLSDASVISALNGEAVQKVEVGGDDNLDVQITSDSCQTIVGLTYVISNEEIIGYKVENIASCQ
ncbi:hypothetical protein EZJ49_07510 [Bdellovibrio bacteriovorus]|uniref:hypothetical protein n=1 Tax=Bdellovibrio bacteriovorus TaxID=959 RepID=UPI0021D17C0D|nr:hypothetical protein [Bdellovibrio bacteriovorus]UXR66095.1 hypothetical protein EZJ49_07510 [Bdellovibrio bacteriovorus]